ncbi:MAG: hypothetical protein WBB34_18970 [Xanthobacteraceae bacterium]
MSGSGSGRGVKSSCSKFRLHAETDAAGARLFEATDYTAWRQSASLNSALQPDVEKKERHGQGLHPRVFDGPRPDDGATAYRTSHQVVLRGRNAARNRDARYQLLQAIEVITRDLSTVRGACKVAEQLDHLGSFDALRCGK